MESKADSLQVLETFTYNRGWHEVNEEILNEITGKNILFYDEYYGSARKIMSASKEDIQKLGKNDHVVMIIL